MSAHSSPAQSRTQSQDDGHRYSSTSLLVALANRSLLYWHAAGWLLLAGLFLPLCRGCSDEVRVPIAELTTPTSLNQVVADGLVLLTFSYALMVALMLTLAAWLRSQKAWWYGYCIQLCLAIGVIACGVCDSIDVGANGSELLEGFLVYTPMFCGFTWWIGRPLWRGDRLLAWSRTQHFFTFVAWIWLQLMSLFASTMLIGYWLSSIAMVLVVIVTETTRPRLAHDIWDPAEPAGHPQYSLKAIFLWMTLGPLVGFYYGAVIPWIKELVSGSR